MTLSKMAFENIVGKGENAGFLLLLQCFLPNERQKSLFEKHSIVICKCFQFGQGKNLVIW